MTIDTGRAVLEDAIRQFPDSSLRAQADYLMAELELEFASDTTSEDDKRRYYENALQRFAPVFSVIIRIYHGPNINWVLSMKRWAKWPPQTRNMQVSFPYQTMEWLLMQ